MIFDVSVAMTWILFLALFPMAFIWLRRAWRILNKKNYAEVAIKHGEPPANPEKWALTVGLLNLLVGAIAAWIIIGVPLYIGTGVLLGPFQSYDSWSALAGVTLWGKIFADFLIKMQAHPFKFGKNKNAKESKAD